MPSGQAAAVNDSADGGEADQRADGAAEEEVDDADAMDGGDTPVADTRGGGEGVRTDAVETTHVGETAGQSQAPRVSPNPPTSAKDDGKTALQREVDRIARMREEDEELSRNMKKWMTWAGIAVGGLVVGYVIASATDSPLESGIDRIIPG